MEAASLPDIECLRPIRSLSQFDDRQLLDLAQKLRIETAPENHCLIERGCSEQFSLYLIDGSLTAISADDKQNRFVSNRNSELFPIAQLRPSMYQVVANDPVSYLRIYTNHLTEFARQLESDPDAIEVIEFEQTREENAFTIQLFQELVSGKLKLPSLPSVAQRIQQAFFDDGVNAELIAGIIQSDPVII